MASFVLSGVLQSVLCVLGTACVVDIIPNIVRITSRTQSTYQMDLERNVTVAVMGASEVASCLCTRYITECEIEMFHDSNLEL